MAHPHVKGASRKVTYLSICPRAPNTSFLQNSTGPSGPSAADLSGTMNSHQPAMVLPKNLRPSAQKTKPPQGVPLHTDVTVLTLADRACLNLLFRSCMLGDFGLGMREVLRFSGVLLGCCLWLTSLQRTWKAL